MKRFKHIIAPGLLIGASLGLTLSSCQKDFNAKSYAPKKPLPIYDGYSSSKDIEPTSLVAYWPFSGSLKDSLSSTTGVATGTSFAAGLSGQALQGAPSSYVISDVPAAVKALHSFTMTLWYNMPENTNGLVNFVNIVNGQNFWGNLDIFIENPPSATSGNLKVHAFNNAAAADTPPAGIDAWEGDYVITNAYNQWNQITVTYNDDTATVTVYYNGSSVGTNTPTGFGHLDWSAATKMVFGTEQFATNPTLTTGGPTDDSGKPTVPSWTNYLVGKMDQVRVYNTVLSSSQIDALYNLEKAGR